MKNVYKNITLMCGCMLFTACPQIDYKHWFIFFNNSESEVYVYLEHTSKEVYTDTISKPQFLIFGPIKKEDSRGISFNSIPDQDTVYIFILADIEIMQKKCEVLQKYNLSLRMNELKNRGSIVSYPPDESMKDVKMWPPYGSTYAPFGRSEYDVYWTELRANRRAEKYFRKHYGVNWDYLGNRNFFEYPLYY